MICPVEGNAGNVFTAKRAKTAKLSDPIFTTKGTKHTKRN